MTTKPPGSQPGDPPGWRLAFAIWESVRHDDWIPILKLGLLVVLILICLTAIIATLGPWSLAALLPTSLVTLRKKSRN